MKDVLAFMASFAELTSGRFVGGFEQGSGIT